MSWHQRVVLGWLPLLVFSVAIGCKTNTLLDMEWPKTTLIVPPPTEQDNSPCGEHLKKLPATQLEIKSGVRGYWVAEQRMQCYIASRRVAKNCRPACEVRVAQVKRGHDHIVKTIETVATAREKQLHQHYQREMVKTAIIAIAVTAGICVVMGGIIMAGVLIK